MTDDEGNEDNGVSGAGAAGAIKLCCASFCRSCIAHAIFDKMCQGWGGFIPRDRLIPSAPRSVCAVILAERATMRLYPRFLVRFLVVALANAILAAGVVAAPTDARAKWTSGADFPQPQSRAELVASVRASPACRIGRTFLSALTDRLRPRIAPRSPRTACTFSPTSVEMPTSHDWRKGGPRRTSLNFQPSPAFEKSNVAGNSTRSS